MTFKLIMRNGTLGKITKLTMAFEKSVLFAPYMSVNCSDVVSQNPKAKARTLEAKT
jgi:hypothetical protein